MECVVIYNRFLYLVKLDYLFVSFIIIGNCGIISGLIDIVIVSYGGILLKSCKIKYIK